MEAVNGVAVHLKMPGSMVLADRFEVASARGIRLPVADIQREVAKDFGLATDEMLARNRARHIMIPRQVAIFLSYGLTPRSYGQLARLFGLTNHTTVMHARMRINDLAVRDSALLERIEAIADRLITNA